MDNASSAPQTDLVPTRLRNALSVFVIFVVSIVLSLSAFIAYSAPRISSRASPNWLVHPTIVYSPFTLRRGNISQIAADGLRIPVYAGAITKELGTFEWVVHDPSATATPSGLVLASFQINAPLATVNSWYQENFPKPYSELRGQQILGAETKQGWFQKLDVHINDETTLYQAVGSDGVRGAILDSLQDSSGTGLTLFYYSEGH